MNQTMMARFAIMVASVSCKFGYTVTFNNEQVTDTYSVPQEDTKQCEHELVRDSSSRV